MFMKKIDFKLNKKKIFIIGGVVLALILLIVGLVILVPKFTYNQEKELTKELKDLGKSFYEDYYYNGLAKTDEEKIEFVSRYKDLGIKVSLSNAARVKVNETDEILKKFVNKKTGEDCDADSSMITIFPKEPYGVKDYSINVNLVCGFEKETTTTTQKEVQVESNKTSEKTSEKENDKTTKKAQ